MEPFPQPRPVFPPAFVLSAGNSRVSFGSSQFAFIFTWLTHLSSSLLSGPCLSCPATWGLPLRCRPAGVCRPGTWPSLPFPGAVLGATWSRFCFGSS